MSENLPSTTNGFDRIHTVTDYYDGPRKGIADFQGKPHVYESMFQDIAGQPDVFLLQPIDDETFRLAMEDWAIWCRWESAYYTKKTTADTHPALPEDRARHDELLALLTPRLQMNPACAFKVRGKFEVITKAQPGLTSSVEIVVCWTSE